MGKNACMCMCAYVYVYVCVCEDMDGQECVYVHV